ncbi:MAG: hypothetical protein A3C84_02660 [Candidatus Ryanbacteria bacterium RIFCSPHIGHO2_02_FULL_48_12]|uniref:Small ribosomal subunit protein bS6 n=1 Tax=Candidatus Ryanbacteria bacterium RIFCSPHIGHO2_01_FULL_48_27 TaxID=1802115 RepID=A0A1G2G5L7_9BACT|nr:MAG: hypothetical protein A2756_01135 [Candidatus Ryanbacteria bacterium RIFCSPHIGHO2_01_FULL_48_27]OGZ49009.1 MAG: hypothetical protein A3C84_02660 [Candidatus Ryanbacteria bacterium RIFCSPHIGHO2_02_FULL_48_12]
MHTDKKPYEVGYLLSPLIPEDGVIKVLEEVRVSIESKGALIDNTQNPKYIRLAYPIKKETHGYFGAIQLHIAPSLIHEVKEALDQNGQILRHLIIEWKKEPPRQQPTLKAFQPKEPAVAGIVAEPAGPVEEKASEQEIDKKLDEILGD